MKKLLTILRFAMIFVCMLALVNVIVFAQNDDEKTRDDAVRLYEQGGTSWAIVIGVGEYEDPVISDLMYAKADAEAVYAYLTDSEGGGFPPHQVRLLLDEQATLSSIKSAFSWLSHAADEEDIVVIYFSGHGAAGPDAGGDETDGMDEYLVQHDAQSSYLFCTAICDDEVGYWLSKIRAEFVLVILEASFTSGGASKYTPSLSRSSTYASDDLLAEPGGEHRLILAAGEPSYYDVSIGHGVFTYFLLHALGAFGEGTRNADANQDGRVTVAELSEYLSVEVPTHTGKMYGFSQHPLIIGELRGGHFVGSGHPKPLGATAVIPVLGERKGGEKAAEVNQLLDEANAAYDQANYYRAIDLYEEALTVCREIGDRSGEAQSLNNLGICHHSLAEYAQAIDRHQQSLAIFQEIGGRRGEAQSLNNLGICHHSLAEYAQAIDCHQQSLAIFQEIGDRQGEAQSLNNLGICHHSLAEYAQAIDCHQQSLAIFQEIGGRRGEAASLGNIGLCYRSLGDYHKALDYHDESLAIEREIGNRGGEARSLGNIGESYRLLGDYRKAIEYYGESLAIFQEIEDRLGEATSLGNLGLCYRSLGDYCRAIDYHEESLVIKREIGDRQGEAEFSNSLGGCYSALGDYEKAIDYSEQALAIHREIGARDGERASLECLGGSYFQWAQYQQAINYAQKALAIAREIGVRSGEASSLGLLGRCYDQLGQYQRAIEYHEQALAIAQGIGACSLEMRCLDDLGVPYRKLGDYQEAISLHTKALAIAQEIGTRPLEAVALDNLGNCYRETGDYEEALDQFTMAQAIFQEIGSLPKQAEGLNNLGLSYEAMENYPMAIDCYTSSLAIAQEIGLSEVSWKAQRGLGKAHWQMGELDLAREEYEQAIAAVEAISGRIQVKGLFRSYLASVQQLYQEYFELLLDMGQAEETIVVSERLRARTFLDLLAQSSEQTLEHLATRGIAGVVDAAAIEQDIQNMVAALPEETATLAYQVINEATYVWVSTGGIWHGPCEIPHCREELMHKIIECRQQIEQADPMANRNLAILYDWLIRPVEDLLPQADEDSPAHLIIIPCGPLFYLPFQALIWTSEDDRTDHAYLVDRYAISYASGVIMVKYVESLGQRYGETSTFTGFANPDAGEAVPRLPEAGTEAYSISAFFPVAQVYVGQNANEDVVRTECGEAQLVLFAVHGKFDPANAMYSYLALTPTQDSDGKLHAREVLNLSLKADMVVLSACETLLPSLKDMQRQVQEVTGSATLNEGQLKELTLGRDFVGLTQSFLESGAASVLASLWSVPSGATSQLMVSFYKHREEGMDKAEALRAAQLEVMNTTGWTQPWYWAAFNLIGDWR